MHQEVKANTFFKNTCFQIRQRLGESFDAVHAPPIWYTDEERLIRATSVCTMGLQDRVLIRTLIHTGEGEVTSRISLWYGMFLIGGTLYIGGDHDEWDEAVPESLSELLEIAQHELEENRPYQRIIPSEAVKHNLYTDASKFLVGGIIMAVTTRD